MASDATGRSSWQALSESFGHTLELSGKRTRMNLRFAGQYFDEETGAYYNQQRDYVSNVGNFIFQLENKGGRLDCVIWTVVTTWSISCALTSALIHE
ncbi:RHS repeat-associated core domain-containing protein [Delftia acidovorans]